MRVVSFYIRTFASGSRESAEMTKETVHKRTIGMEYTDFKRLIDSLRGRNKETEWIEFKANFHSKEEIGEHRPRQAETHLCLLSARLPEICHQRQDDKPKPSGKAWDREAELSHCIAYYQRSHWERVDKRSKERKWIQSNCFVHPILGIVNIFLVTICNWKCCLTIQIFHKVL